jgi:hypothetical protein
MPLSACRASADSLGQPDENALGASDVAEPIHVFILDHFVDELRAVLSEPGERIVEVVHREHDTQIAQRIHGSVPVIGDHRRREKAREFDPAVAVRRTHHGDFDALVVQSSHAPGPVAFDHGSPFELEAQLGEKRDSSIKRFHHDADVVHPLKRHAAILASRRDHSCPRYAWDSLQVPCSRPGLGIPLHNRTAETGRALPKDAGRLLGPTPRGSRLAPEGLGTRLNIIPKVEEGSRTMSRVQKFSEGMIDLAERIADVDDAARGKRRRGATGTTRWLFLPATGAGLYALVRSNFGSSEAREVMDKAKTRASELPSDLMKTVRQVAQKQTPQRSAGSQPAQKASNRTGDRRRQRASARKTTSRT